MSNAMVAQVRTHLLVMYQSWSQPYRLTKGVLASSCRRSFITTIIRFNFVTAVSPLSTFINRLLLRYSKLNLVAEQVSNACSTNPWAHTWETAIFLTIAEPYVAPTGGHRL